MSRCWLALVEGPAKGADAAAAASTADGHPAGTLAAWRRRAKPVRDALRVDEHLIDPNGSAAWISLVLPPPCRSMPESSVAYRPQPARPSSATAAAIPGHGNGSSERQSRVRRDPDWARSHTELIGQRGSVIARSHSIRVTNSADARQTTSRCFTSRLARGARPCSNHRLITHAPTVATARPTGSCPP